MKSPCSNVSPFFFRPSQVSKISLAIGILILNTQVHATDSKNVRASNATAHPQTEIPEMVKIPGGCFHMGSLESEEGRDRDERRHRVCVENFAIGKYEVTFAQYDAFAKATDRQLPSDQGWGRGEQRPVINVSWEDATAYAKWLSAETGKAYRLPTEAEWEYACRGGSQDVRYCGSNDVDTVAWHKGNSERKSHPIGQKQANSYGLYDMSGNVWEWTCSPWDETYQGKETQCAPEKSDHHALRGGSWGNSAKLQRAALRDYDAPNHYHPIYGFRLAQDPAP